MKILVNILCFLLIVVQTVSAQDCKSIVKINTGKDDLLIFIDDEYIGNGSIETKLEAGNHKVKIKEPGLRWDARSLLKEISIEDCAQNYNFSFSFDNEYLLDTSPEDVYVFENDSLLGNTPLLISKNIETVELKKNDYKPKVITLSEVDINNPVKLEFTGELKSKSFTETPFFELLIGTAVGFGAIAAYYKIRADESFDKYEETKEQKYLDDTNRYDNYSGIAFGVLQVNFGALIYFLLSDQ